MGAACELARMERVQVHARLSRLKDRFYDQLRKRIPDVRLNGHIRKRIPGNMSFTFLSVDAQVLLKSLPEAALSTGSACSSAIPKPSHVLNAIGLTPKMSAGTIRIGLGKSNTESEVDELISMISTRIQFFRQKSNESDSSVSVQNVAS